MRRARVGNIVLSRRRSTSTGLTRVAGMRSSPS